MKTFLELWVTAGLTLDAAFLLACYLINSGYFGLEIKAQYQRNSRMTLTLILMCLEGLAVPPLIIALLLYFAFRIKSARASERERTA
jgi:hypothetical protein